MTKRALAITLALYSYAASSAEIPNDNVTPGVIAEDGHDVNVVCGTQGGLSYSKRHRATPGALKTMLRKRDHCDPHNSEVDHRLPLALGGADVVYNLWCQPGPAPGITWNYHDKDRLELQLWEAVCKRKTMRLEEAQGRLMTPADWRNSYCMLFPDDVRCQ